MFNMALSVFTEDESFPFFIQFGGHKNGLYMHVHTDFSELVIVTEGSAEHIVNQERYRIQKGDVFVINNDTAHGYEDTQNFQICNIMFRPSFWLGGEYDIVKTAGFQALFVLEPHYVRQSRFSSRLRLTLDEYMGVVSVCNELYREYTDRRDGWKTAFTADFLRLSASLSRMYRIEQVDAKDIFLNLAKSVAFMETHFTENVSVAQLARMSNYSERQFIRVFEKAYRCRPTDYLTNLRIRCACRLLETTRSSVTEVALKSGYGDCNYFSRMFRKQLGVTPTQYRTAAGVLHF
ncbi:MAG: AraC family transcriptional regulator [Oscillospiraceae bacterium]